MIAVRFWIVACLLVSCHHDDGASAAQPTTNAAPASGAATTASGPPFSVDTVNAGYIEYRKDGTCWYGSDAHATLVRATCWDVRLGGEAKQPATLKPAPTHGWIEKREDGSCLAAASKSYRCPEGAMCKPNAPAEWVECPTGAAAANGECPPTMKLGDPCQHEGQTCGSVGSGWGNVLECAGGRWTGHEVPPAPGSPDYGGPK